MLRAGQTYPHLKEEEAGSPLPLGEGPGVRAIYTAPNPDLKSKLLLLRPPREFKGFPMSRVEFQRHSSAWSTL
jgi:hypothetical protein